MEKVQRTAVRWACRRWRNTSSVGDMMEELEWPTQEARREQSSLTFFYKNHSSTVCLEKDTYLTPAPNLISTRASHDLQYTKYLAYRDALKNSFFPRNFPACNILPFSVVSSNTTEEFKALIYITVTKVCVLECLCSLLERLRTHKVFTKDQRFYLNYHKFSIKSYVLDVY